MKQYIVVKDTKVTPFQHTKNGGANYYPPVSIVVDWYFTEADIINGQQFSTWYILLPNYNSVDKIYGFTVNINSIIEYE